MLSINNYARLMHADFSRLYLIPQGNVSCLGDPSSKSSGGIIDTVHVFSPHGRIFPHNRRG